MDTQVFAKEDINTDSCNLSAGEYFVQYFELALFPGALQTSASYTKQSRQDHLSSQSHWWSVLRQVDWNIAWNFLWCSARRYSSPFGPCTRGRSVISKNSGGHSSFNTGCLGVHKVPTSTCCHPVRTIFTVLWCLILSFNLTGDPFS